MRTDSLRRHIIASLCPSIAHRCSAPQCRSIACPYNAQPSRTSALPFCRISLHFVPGLFRLCAKQTNSLPVQCHATPCSSDSVLVSAIPSLLRSLRCQGNAAPFLARSLLHISKASHFNSQAIHLSADPILLISMLLQCLSQQGFSVLFHRTALLLRALPSHCASTPL